MVTAYSVRTRSFAVHPALRQRIEASKAAAATATFHRDQSRATVPSDVGMATVCGHMDDDDDFYVVDMPEPNHYDRDNRRGQSIGRL